MRPWSRPVALAAALAAVLLALVAYALLAVERPDEAARGRHDRDTLALPFRPGDAIAVSLAPRGAPELRLRRNGDGWRLPDGAPAGPSTVEGLLGQLSGMRVRSAMPATPEALASRGLVPPVTRVSVTLRDGAVLSLELGDENPFDRARFARREGEILVVEGVPPAALDAAPDRFMAPP